MRAITEDPMYDAGRDPIAGSSPKRPAQASSEIHGSKPTPSASAIRLA